MARGKKAAATLTPEEKLQQALVPVEEQPYDIPENWCWTKQGIISTFLNGRAYKKTELLEDNTLTPILRVGNLFTNDSWYYSDLSLEENKYIDNNDLIYAWSASFGPFIWHGNKVIYHYHIWKIQLSTALSKEYYYFWLMNDTERLKGGGHGTGMIHVTKEMMEHESIPLPPIAEQQRIVDRIERIFAKLDEAKEKAQAVVNGFELRKSAILHKAFTGELTAQWRQEHRRTIKEWQDVTLGEIASFHQGIQVPVDQQFEENDETRVRFIRIVDYTQGNEEPRYIDKSIIREGSLVDGDEIVMVRYGASAGFIGDSISGIIANNMFIVNVDKDVIPYLKCFLKSPQMFSLLNHSGGSSAMPALNFKTISTIKIPLPPIEEQKEIIRLVKSPLEKLEQANDNAEKAVLQIEIMKKTVLARAFRGELGTNDPAEESAMELLKGLL